MKKFYTKSVEEVMKILGVTKKGLNDVDVEGKREQYGFNQLEESDKKTTLQVLLQQFKDFLVLILLGAAIISAFLGKFESTLVIIVVVIINAVLGTVQHIKAEKSIESLKALSAPITKVIRNGQKIEIPLRQVVVGDIISLEAGDYVSADARIIENFSLQVNESSLTGESESVVKQTEIIEGDNTALGDRKNMVFSGSYVTYGRALAVVTAIGMKTEIGNIASLLESAKEKKTPLQENLDDFGKKLAVAILVICGLIFFLNTFRGNSVIDSFMFAVSLAVAAIPEALSSIVTIVLAIGTRNMAKKNAIVRKLHSVESLGSISVICSDKTGTLTQNKMTVQKIFVDGKIIDTVSINKEDKLEKKLISMALLCNDAVTIKEKEIGDPTEVALVNFGELYGLDELIHREQYERIGEIPFDSDRKLMSTVNKINNKTFMITKGALDVILSRTIGIETSEGIGPINKELIENTNKEFSKQGLRVLAFGYKEIKENKEITLEDEKDLIFIGFVAMMDPPRKESAVAVKDCIGAGIKPVMITGDHVITATAIANQIGILKNENEAVEGYMLDSLSDEELREKVDNISVYARVSPEHKIRIVKAWQEKGNVVAMTGDGVNDAPALKQADIGVAMGITGTEVAKDAAAMVLADDNFETIVNAISNGRSIYENIKNAIKFLLSGNTAGILVVIYTALLALPIPFSPVHLLFINLLTDSLPAIAIGLEPLYNDVMKEKPRTRDTSLLDKDFATGVIIEGVIICISTLIAFYLGLTTGNKYIASTMAFSTLCLSRLVHGFNCRSKKSLFRVGFFSNRYVWIAFLVGYLLLNLTLRIGPLMTLFEVAPLDSNQFMIINALSIIPLISVQLYKVIFIDKKY